LSGDFELDAPNDWIAMRPVLLLTPACPRHADVVEPRRVRLRDRLRARLSSHSLDRRLADGVPPERDAALTLRARRLVEPGTAALLARALQRVLRDAATPQTMLPTGMPTRRRAVLDAAVEIEDLARRLVAPAPAAVRGIAQVGLLISDGTGPLYSAFSAEDLVAAVRRARAALELV
jgi:hypothetical protein